MDGVFKNKGWAQLFALVFGFSYLVSGIAAFFFSEGLTGGEADDKLIFFHTNYLHATLHTALGVAWMVSSRTEASALRVNFLFGTALLVLAALGFAGLDLMHTFLNVQGSFSAENFLHLGNGLLALYFGRARERHRRILRRQGYVKADSPGHVHTFADRGDIRVLALNVHAPAGFDLRLEAD